MTEIMVRTRGGFLAGYPIPRKEIPIPVIKIPKLRKIPNPGDKNPETKKNPESWGLNPELRT